MTSSEFAKALREVADWYDAHPDVPAPNDLGIFISAEDTKEEARRIAAVLGHCKKQWTDSCLLLVKDFGGISLYFTFWRSTVCERRVVGTREIPDQLIPAHTEEVVEWDCHPILADEESA